MTSVDGPNFSLNEEHQMIRAAARDFAQNEIAPPSSKPALKTSLVALLQFSNAILLKVLSASLCELPLVVLRL